MKPKIKINITGFVGFWTETGGGPSSAVLDSHDARRCAFGSHASRRRSTHLDQQSSSKQPCRSDKSLRSLASIESSVVGEPVLKYSQKVRIANLNLNLDLNFILYTMYMHAQSITNNVKVPNLSYHSIFNASRGVHCRELFDLALRTTSMSLKDPWNNMYKYMVMIDKCLHIVIWASVGFSKQSFKISRSSLGWEIWKSPNRRMIRVNWLKMRWKNCFKKRRYCGWIEGESNSRRAPAADRDFATSSLRNILYINWLPHSWLPNHLKMKVLVFNSNKHRISWLMSPPEHHFSSQVGRAGQCDWLVRRTNTLTLHFEVIIEYKMSHHRL